MREFKQVKSLTTLLESFHGNGVSHVAQNFIMQITNYLTTYKNNITTYKEGTVSGDINLLNKTTLTYNVSSELYGRTGGFLLKETTDFIYYLLARVNGGTIRLEKVDKSTGVRTILTTHDITLPSTYTNATTGSVAQNNTFFGANYWVSESIVTPTHILIPYGGYQLSPGYDTTDNRIMFYTMDYTFDETTETLAFGTPLQQTDTFLLNIFDKSAKIKKDTDNTFIYSYYQGSTVKLGRVLINGTGGLTQLWEYELNYTYTGGILDINFIDNYFFITDSLYSGSDSSDGMTANLVGFSVDDLTAPTAFTEIQHIALSGGTLQGNIPNYDSRKKNWTIIPLISDNVVYLDIWGEVVKVGSTFTTTTNGNIARCEMFRYGDNVVGGNLYYTSGTNVYSNCSIRQIDSYKLNGIYTQTSIFKLASEHVEAGYNYKIQLEDKVTPSDTSIEIWVRKDEDDNTWAQVTEDTFVEDIHNSLMVEARCFPSTDNLDTPTITGIKIIKST